LNSRFRRELRCIGECDVFGVGSVYVKFVCVYRKPTAAILKRKLMVAVMSNNANNDLGNLKIFALGDIDEPFAYNQYACTITPTHIAISIDYENGRSFDSIYDFSF